jgi:hypothetical protein
MAIERGKVLWQDVDENGQKHPSPIFVSIVLVEMGPESGKKELKTDGDIQKNENG